MKDTTIKPTNPLLNHRGKLGQQGENKHGISINGKNSFFIRLCPVLKNADNISLGMAEGMKMNEI